MAKKTDPFKAEEYRIFAAIRDNNIDRVKELIAADPELVNSVAPKRPLDTRGMSPLQVALSTGWHKDIADFLLDSGADVNYFPGDEWKSTDPMPVLFFAVNIALYNSRRYELKDNEFVWRHTKEESDRAFALLERFVSLGADVNKTDKYGRNSLFEAVASANMTGPLKNYETGEYYPGRKMTPEQTEDIRRVIGFLIDSGADKKSYSSFTKKDITGTFKNEFVWTVIGDMFT